MNRREDLIKQIYAERAYVYESLLTCSGYGLEGKHFLMLTQEELDAFRSESPTFRAFFDKAIGIKMETGEAPPTLPNYYTPDWNATLLAFLRAEGLLPKETKSHRHRKISPRSYRKRRASFPFDGQ